MILVWVLIVVVVVVAAAVATAAIHRRSQEPDHSDVPPGTHSRSRKPPIGAQDTNDPIAPPEAAVDMPTDVPENAPDIAAPEAGVPSPSKSGDKSFG